VGLSNLSKNAPDLLDTVRVVVGIIGEHVGRRELLRTIPSLKPRPKRLKVNRGVKKEDKHRGS
jgi:predicted metal-dependent RNase